MKMLSYLISFLSNRAHITHLSFKSLLCGCPSNADGLSCTTVGAGTVEVTEVSGFFEKSFRSYISGVSHCLGVPIPRSNALLGSYSYACAATDATIISAGAGWSL
ncbi:hypothetical protein PIB30_082213 [Stylosanthes scabra]|uniref:Secreted protein n=1 Tax=Stylosanthes scabra TaxID=79078 RepID=A0ABU6WRU7_9FABA|nr:hypothetical protein [Stylosanthes scabra]